MHSRTKISSTSPYFTSSPNFTSRQMLESKHAYSIRARPARAMAPAPAAEPLLAAPVYCQTAAELVPAGATGEVHEAATDELATGAQV